MASMQQGGRPGAGADAGTTAFAPGWHEGLLPLDAPLPAAADYLAQCQADGAFGDRETWLLIPDQMLLAPLLEELRARLPAPLLRRWRIHTLQSLAAAAPLPVARQPAARREALLHAALKPHGWFDERSLWAVTGELGALFDALTLANSPLPDNLDALIDGLRAAYDLRPVQGLCFEAALVLNAWQALVTQPDEGMDPMAAYCLALGQVAAAPGPPLVSIGLTALAPVEAAFLRNAAVTRPVHVLRPDCSGATATDGLARMLAAAWPEAATAAALTMERDPPPPTGLRARAAALRQRTASSPLAGRVSCYAAATLEAHAAGVADEIRRWRTAGCARIAVLVHDRAAARRLQARLACDGIRTVDEMGWTLTTTAAAAAVGALLEAALAPADAGRLRRLLLSPHVWGDLGAADAERLRAQLGQAQCSWGPHADAATLAGVARQDGRETLAVALERMAAALGLLGDGVRRQVDWLHALQGAMAQLGLDAGLLRDAGGIRLLELLAEAEAALEEDSALHDLVDFGRWLHRLFENSKCRDDVADGEVVFTRAEAARLRRFDGVVVFGADADRLPALPAAGQVLGEQARVWLGLPGRARHFAAQAAALLQVLAPAGRILFSWQSQRADGNILPSPWVARLDVLHECAWGAPVARLAAAAPAAVCSPPAGVRPPAPPLPADLVPAALSLRALRALRTCPYQFYILHVLGLKPLPEAGAPAGRREFGQAVHRILERFGRECPQLAGLPPGRAEAVLQRAAQAELTALAASDPCQGWQQRFAVLAGPFLDWVRAREAAGWGATGSARLSRWLPLADGRRLQIYARVDRVERRIDDPAVIALTDYRTGSRPTAGDADADLSVLAWLADAPAVETASLSLVDGRLFESRREAAAADPARAAGELAELAGALTAGRPLAATGAPEDCRRCEARGLCRRAHWPSRETEATDD